MGILGGIQLNYVEKDWKSIVIKMIVITPGYISHYKPIVMFLKSCNLSGDEVLIATSVELQSIVEDDGFSFCEFEAWKNSNPGRVDMEKQLAEERQILEASYESTYKGMTSALYFQAEHRIHDLFARLEEIENDICQLINIYHPKLFLSVQLCYNVTAILEKLQVRYITYVTGNPDQLPRPNEVYGYPHFPPKSIIINNTELESLYHYCSDVQQTATEQFYRLTGRRIDNIFSVASKDMILYNFPRVLIKHRNVLAHEYYLGASCRPCETEPQLEMRLREMKASGRPIVYVSFGTVFSVRGDVLKKIYQALACMELYVVASIGVLEEKYRPYLQAEWIVGEFLPQMLILKYADLLVGHGGNNSITEALANGVPVVAFPFASDQFFSARAIEENSIGTVCDPNYADVNEIRNKLIVALRCKSSAVMVSQDIVAQQDKMLAIKKIKEMLEE